MNDYEKNIIKRKLANQGIIVNKIIKLGLQLDKDIFNWSIREIETRIGTLTVTEEVNLNIAKIEQLKILTKLIDSYERILTCERDLLVAKQYY